MSIAPLRIFDFWATTDQPRRLGLLLTQAGIDPAHVSDDGAKRFLAHVGAVDAADTILNGPISSTPELGPVVLIAAITVLRGKDGAHTVADELWDPSVSIRIVRPEGGESRP